jgi:hypothetical protein
MELLRLGCVRSCQNHHLSGQAHSNPPGWAVTRRGHAAPRHLHLRSRTRANTFSSLPPTHRRPVSVATPAARAGSSIGPSALGDQDHMGEMGAIAMCTGRVVLDGGEMDPSHLRMHGSHLRPISSRRRACLRSAIDARLGVSVRGARPRCAHAHTSSGAQSQCILPDVPSLSDERHLLSCGSPRLDPNAPCAEYLLWRLFHSPHHAARLGRTSARPSIMPCVCFRFRGAGSDAGTGALSSDPRADVHKLAGDVRGISPCSRSGFCSGGSCLGIQQARCCVLLLSLRRQNALVLLSLAHCSSTLFACLFCAI